MFTTEDRLTRQINPQWDFLANEQCKCHGSRKLHSQSGRRNKECHRKTLSRMHIAPNLVGHFNFWKVCHVYHHHHDLHCISHTQTPGISFGRNWYVAGNWDTPNLQWCNDLAYLPDDLEKDQFRGTHWVSLSSFFDEYWVSSWRFYQWMQGDTRDYMHN